MPALSLTLKKAEEGNSDVHWCCFIATVFDSNCLGEEVDSGGLWYFCIWTSLATTEVDCLLSLGILCAAMYLLCCKYRPQQRSVSDGYDVNTKYLYFSLQWPQWKDNVPELHIWIKVDLSRELNAYLIVKVYFKLSGRGLVSLIFTVLNLLLWLSL